MTWLALTLALAAVDPPPSTKERCETLRENAKFAVHFERVELAKLVQTVSDATCKTFLVSEGLKGSISLVGPENTKLTLNGEQFYAAFLAALDANGFTVLQQGRLYRIIEKARARQLPVPLTLPGTPFPQRDEVISRVFRLAHAELEPTRQVLSNLVTPGGDLLPMPPDLLMVTDVVANLERLEKVMAMLDSPRALEVTRLVPVKHAEATEIADKLTRLLVSKAPQRPQDVMQAVADERTNRVLLVGTDAQVSRAETLLHQLDVPVVGDGRARVYRLKHADAKEVAQALEGLATQTKGKAQAGPGAAPAVVGDVKVTVNEALNALVIVASSADYRSLAEVITELDVPVRQVLIETVIMEVNVERDRQLGVSMHTVAGTADMPIVLGSQPAGAPSSLTLKSLAASSGFVGGIQGPVLTQVSKLIGLDIPAFGIAIQALQSDSDVNVMSTPYILTTDNKEAEISVGQRIPFQQGTSPAQLQQLLSSGNAAAASTLSSFGSSVTRERVELKLNVKPHIGDGDHVRLDVQQTLEEIAGENSLGPITSTRAQKATVVARDAQTLVLGGLMQERVIESASKTPLLGDIPVIGNLFRRTAAKKTKVNLLVFLTPHIIRDVKDIDRLVEKRLAERRALLDYFYAGSRVSEPPQDLGRRRGPLSTFFHATELAEKQAKHGEAVLPGDAVVVPVE